MKLIIEDDEGRKTVVPVVREEITIGRQDGNTIRLTERNVSRRHARLVKDNGHLVIEDLGSYNGVRVNGEKIAGPTPIKEGDLVEIGDYDLGIQGKFEASAPGAQQPMKQGTMPPQKPAAKPAPPPEKPQPVQAAPPPAADTSQDTPVPEASQPAQPSAGGATAIIRVSDIMKSAPQVEARDLQRGEMPRLVGLQGAIRGKEFYLMRSEVKFGRTDENDISIDHQSVSRSHAKFVLDAGQWKVFDNKSANGVRVNGDEYAVSNVNPGDTIELGHLKFRFCAPGEKFTPPPEKTEEAPTKGGLKPTTAELIAGAQNRGPQASSSAAKKKSGPPIGIIAGAVIAVLVIGGGAFFMMGKKGGNPDDPDSLTGANAAKAAEAAFKQHHYLEAQKLFEQAGDAPSPDRKRVAEEARGEELYNATKTASDSGDGDKARAAFDKCASESTYWCTKAQNELADPVKAAYAKKHLATANAAKAAGKNEQCLAEANAILQFDSTNAEASQLVTACAPQEAAATPKQVAPKPQASGENKEAKAAKLAKSSADKLVGRDFAGAVQDAKAALAEHPNDKATLGLAYRSLGYGYAYLSDNDSAKKWLKQYRPFCTNDCPQVDAFLSR